MDDQRIAEIRARLAAVTPGPWGVWRSMDNTLDVLAEHEHPHRPVLSMYGDLGDHPSEREAADAEFVAASREDVPYLLASLASAEARAARYREALEELAASCERWSQHAVASGGERVIHGQHASIARDALAAGGAPAVAQLAPGEG